MASVTFVDAMGRTEMKIANSTIDGANAVVNPFSSRKIIRAFERKQAKLRTTTSSPTFEASSANNVYVSEKISLLVLTSKSKGRELEIGKMKYLSDDGTFAFRSQDLIPIKITEIKEQNAPGSSYKRYSIKTVNPLPPGEYALYTNGTYYDFGVDPVLIASSDARIKWATAQKLLLGSWRFDNSVITYNADGTKIDTFDNGNSTKSIWSVDGDIITLGMVETNGKRLEATRQSQFQIIELTEEKFVSKGPDGKEWHAVRVKK